MLAYSGYFVDCLWSCLVEVEEAKNIEGDLTINAFIWVISTGNASIWDSYVGTRLSNISCWLSIK